MLVQLGDDEFSKLSSKLRTIKNQHLVSSHQNNQLEELRENQAKTTLTPLRRVAMCVQIHSPSQSLKRLLPFPSSTIPISILIPLNAQTTN